ncbi:hypothetical protein IRT45_13100 [Nocardia sp. BSTN01]|uniref:hypothetical protein n=1 Tax=Nocardia sp. BSTN01 TaxID=2783665 RepID=UPI00188DDFED|nr:hypothetical protein [Nocardia sp. BSTN01]MBF4998089.1 hypothetical protein [Nocardia sp. BSTN01]
MNARTPAEVLREARRRDSREKRARVLATLEQMLERGDTITAASVAHAAKVSTWLVYAPGIREHLEKARRQQTHTSLATSGRVDSVGVASLRTDLELA